MSLDTIPPHVLDAAIVADEAIDAANDAAEQRIRSNADLAIATHASHLLGRCDWPAKANSWHWP
jgi:hypothetical protein